MRTYLGKRTEGLESVNLELVWYRCEEYPGETWNISRLRGVPPATVGRAGGRGRTQCESTMNESASTANGSTLLTVGTGSPGHEMLGSYARFAQVRWPVKLPEGGSREIVGIDASKSKSNRADVKGSLCKDGRRRSSGTPQRSLAL